MVMTCLSLTPDHCEASGCAKCVHHGDALSHQADTMELLRTLNRNLGNCEIKSSFPSVLHSLSQAFDDGDKAPTHTWLHRTAHVLGHM